MSEDLTTTLSRELMATLCGERIGSGSGREVYICKPDPKLVVKIEMNGRSFQNVIEWEIWETLRCEKKKSRWLVPCTSISPCGIVLIQRRTEPARKKELPKRLPAWLTDHKQENFGMLDGRLVCHDYGTVLIQLAYMARANGLRKADWK